MKLQNVTGYMKMKEAVSSLSLSVFPFIYPLIYVIGARKRHFKDPSSNVILNFQMGPTM